MDEYINREGREQVGLVVRFGLKRSKEAHFYAQHIYVEIAYEAPTKCSLWANTKVCDKVLRNSLMSLSELKGASRGGRAERMRPLTRTCERAKKTGTV